MGSGSSNTKPKQANKSVQVVPIVEDSRAQSPLFRSVSKVIPPKVQSQSYADDRFHIETNIEDYSSIWDHETKVNRSNIENSSLRIFCVLVIIIISKINKIRSRQQTRTSSNRIIHQ